MNELPITSQLFSIPFDINAFCQKLKPARRIGEICNYLSEKILVDGREYSIASYRKIHVAAIGKAASQQIAGFDTIWDLIPGDKKGNRISLTKRGMKIQDSSLIQLEGSHPIIDREGLAQSQIFIDQIGQFRKEDLLIVFLSGGASALLESLNGGVEWEEYQNLVAKLIHSNLNIETINEIRKGLSRVKNGGLVKHIPCSDILQFVSIDVPGEDPRDVGSAPFMYRPLNRDIIEQGLVKILNQDQVDKFYSLIEDHGGEGCAKVETKILFAPSMQLDWIKDVCQSLFREEFPIYSRPFSEDYPHELKRIKESDDRALFSGGEMPVSVENSGGKGGRNLHYVAQLGHDIFERYELGNGPDELHKFALFSFGTDGDDGNSGAAGAWLDYRHYLIGRQKGLNLKEFIDSFDTYSYFDQIGCIIRTGPTGNNLMDFRAFFRME